MQRRHMWIIALLLAVVGIQAWQHATHVGSAAPVQDTAQDAGPSRHVEPPSVPQPSPIRAPEGVSRPTAGPATLPAGLPPEAADTLQRIARNGPFHHRQDGAVFQNREHRLPARPDGWYHEYTVETPGSRDRGARRIIVAGDPPAAYFYTDDHYRSFRRFDMAAAP